MYFNYCIFRVFLNFGGIFFCLGLILFNCGKSEKADLTIVAAANTATALKEAVREFEQDEKITCTVIFSSSGKLYAQIKEGAPYDIFISADMDYPNALYESTRHYPPPIPYAKGRLILYSAKIDSLQSVDKIAQLENGKFALANPKTAPYGRAGEQALKSLGFYDKIKDNLIFGESIGQTNQFLYSGAADLGITSLSSVVEGEMATKGSYIVLDQSLHDPIVQGLIILNSESESVISFKNFLLSQKGKKILTKYGYEEVDE